VLAEAGATRPLIADLNNSAAKREAETLTAAGYSAGAVAY